MTAVTTPPSPLPTGTSGVPGGSSGAPASDPEPSLAITDAPGVGVQTPHTPSQAVRPGADSLTIGQAASLTGLHKNTIRAYIKQGRIAAGVVRGKYGQEYRLERAEVVALASLIAPPAGQEPGLVPRPVTPVVTPDPQEPVTVGDAGRVGASQGSVGASASEDSLGLLGDANSSIAEQGSGDSSHRLSLEPLVGLMRQLQEENRTLAGQLGFVQAQLQQARETIRLLQAPPDVAEGEDLEVEVPGPGRSTEEVERLTGELEQARRRVAEVEAAQRPWWRRLLG